jgi:hypothetical protein
MILRTVTLTFDTTHPVPGSAPELREFLATEFARYSELHRQDAGSFIHRYPVVQCKMIRDYPTVIGINEGALFLKEFTDKTREFPIGPDTYRIAEHDILIRDEEFGIYETTHAYEFATPWLALTQENYKRFYKLTGKPARDAFVQKIFVDTLLSLSNALGYKVPAPILCDTNFHFQKDQLNRTSVMTFTGKFQANFQIPEYLGIGKSVSQGYGAVRRIFREIRKS